MLPYRFFTEPSFRFKEDPQKYDPFPPEHYENEKRAKALIAQMTTPPKMKQQP